MPEHEKDTAAKLRKLAARLRLGYQKLHPVKESELDLVRDAVRQEWDKEQELARESEELEQKSSAAGLETAKEEEQERKKQQERSEQENERERER